VSLDCSETQLLIWTRLPQFSDLSWLSPFGLAPLTTCAQVDKSERKLRDFAQVRVILAGAP